MGSQQTSATLASEFITEARNNYNDTSYFDELLTFLNDGVMDISVKTHSSEGQELITITNGQIDCGKLNSNFVEVKSVEVTISGETFALKNSFPGMIGLDTYEGDTDHPAFYHEFGGHIYIHPVDLGVERLYDSTGEPLFDSTGEPLYVHLTLDGRVLLSKTPRAVASTETVNMPAIHDRHLIMYMLMRMALRDRNIGLLKGLSSIYHSDLGMNNG